MLCTKFADLCGISRTMVSKYKRDGMIVFTDASEKHVDPEMSLEAMAGRFNEAQRQMALVKLAELRGMEAQVRNEMPRPLAGQRPNLTIPRQDDAQKPVSAKQQKDLYDAGLKRLEYMRRAGELLLVSDVARSGTEAVNGMRETFSNGRRDMARAFCAKFDLPPDRETAVVRFLGDQFEAALGRFAELAAKMADPTVVLPAAFEAASAAALESGELPF